MTARGPGGRFVHTCDLCGLPDPYDGQGDDIGSCGCPRCDCGAGPAGSSIACLCDFPGEDYYDDEDEEYVRPITDLSLPPFEPTASSR
ncbi:hypothetical protein [Actinocorallia longicatena]|uniref:Uncharacterized protein n=1 Tax=Actinocorallia longicatena TaxID=111803 RepID=A0ABP6QDY6_9ACTN